MARPLIVFSHGNSFPASTYRKVFEGLRVRGFDVKAVEKFGHDPKYPVSNNWPHLVAQLGDFVQPLARKAPVLLVGHSLGGFLSLMTAAKHPEWVRGVVMLDSPLVAGWRANLVRMSKSLSIIRPFSPGAKSYKRRTSWANEEEALAHFAAKRQFARWDPEVLRDYIRYGTRDELTPQGTRRVLTFDREIETAIYTTLPDHIESYLRQHPLQCKAALVGGILSRELKQAGMRFTRHITKGRVIMLDGTHLFPMEHPLVTAAAIETAWLNLRA